MKAGIADDPFGLDGPDKENTDNVVVSPPQPVGEVQLPQIQAPDGPAGGDMAINN